MRQTKTNGSNPESAELLRRLKRDKREWEGWRQKRRGRERIPEYLWARALSYVGELSLTRISREFRVNFEVLKQMNARAEKKGPGGRAPQFIDVTPWLRGEAGEGLPSDRQRSSALVLERPDGNRLRMEGVLPELGYLEGVVRIFLGARS